MNNRIKELAEQAGSTHKQSLGVYQFYSDELEKFAELIVKECAEFTHPVTRKFIMEHFGVEDEVEYCPKCNAEWSGTSCGLNDCGWISRSDIDE